jgi:hypothetical protein
MGRFEVTSSIPDTSIFHEDSGERRDRWAFHHLMFYALPPIPGPYSGQQNEWVMTIVEICERTHRWRHVKLKLTHNSWGDVIQVAVEKTDDQEPTGSLQSIEVKLISSKIDEATGNSVRVKYLHWQLLDDLVAHDVVFLRRAGLSQLQFCLNFVGHLVEQGVVSEETRDKLKKEVAILRTEFNSTRCYTV